MAASKQAYIRTCTMQLRWCGDRIGSPQQISYMRFGARKTLSEHLQTFYTPWGGQNELSKLLQGFYTLCGAQNGLSELLQRCYTLCSKLTICTSIVTYTLCGDHNVLSKLIASYRMFGCQNWSLPTGTSFLHALRISKLIFRTSKSLLHALGYS